MGIESESGYSVGIFPDFFDDGIPYTRFGTFGWIFGRDYVNECCFIQILWLFSHIHEMLLRRSCIIFYSFLWTLRTFFIVFLMGIILF